MLSLPVSLPCSSQVRVAVRRSSSPRREPSFSEFQPSAASLVAFGSRLHRLQSLVAFVCSWQLRPHYPSNQSTQEKRVTHWQPHNMQRTIQENTHLLAPSPPLCCSLQPLKASLKRSEHQRQRICCSAPIHAQKTQRHSLKQCAHIEPTHLSYVILRC